MSDVSVYETGDGGDVILRGNDIVLTDSFYNMPYLAWFGGNPGFVTTGNELENEQRFDWWGNSLLFENDPVIQFNSFLEHALNTTALDSQGRLTIENIVKRDLQFFGTFATVEVDVSIISDSRVKILATIKEPGNLDQKEFQFIWDATKQEIIVERTL